ncbi:hypothetical protein ISN44_As12g002800 [Arabidopsis suecica]|uniref:Uncharacterized protein n=1 Tax=Arabidopsis suecica TaxID=45249 RepID=A0A8T1YF82_ARASU|nr:hypothetical protein ISN44_As12g002800 [Arabidopsis suecica]
MESERYKNSFALVNSDSSTNLHRSVLKKSFLFRHLEKQKELLKEAHKTMLQELQKLEVEHETMMRKLYELMNTHTLNQKKMEETQNVLEGRETIEASSQSTVTSDDEEH